MVIKGDAVDSLQVQNGESLKVSVEIESREFKEKWYTEIRAWKVEPAVDSSEGPSNSSGDNPF